MLLDYGYFSLKIRTISTKHDYNSGNIKIKTFHNCHNMRPRLSLKFSFCLAAGVGLLFAHSYRLQRYKPLYMCFAVKT